MNYNLIQKIIQNESANTLKNDNNLNNSEKTFPDFSEYLGPKINIEFCISNGYKYFFYVPCSVPVSKLFSVFTRCHGLDEALIDKDIIFLYNAERLKKDEQRTVADIGFKNGSQITVLDQEGYFNKFIK